MTQPCNFLGSVEVVGCMLHNYDKWFQHVWDFEDIKIFNLEVGASPLYRYNNQATAISFFPKSSGNLDPSKRNWIHTFGNLDPQKSCSPVDKFKQINSHAKTKKILVGEGEKLHIQTSHSSFLCIDVFRIRGKHLWILQLLFNSKFPPL